MELEFELLEKLKKDIKHASETLNEQEARFLVDLYYQIQKFRIQTGNQIRILTKDDEQESHETLRFFNEQYRKLENDIQACLKVYAQSKQIGRWMMSICGIGPVIAAGFIAHIDINKAETAGAIWRFAGLDPTLPPMKKGVKLAWNKKLKVLCWKLGQSFVKVSNNDKDVYGHIYRERKEYEIKRNEAGENAEIAKQALEKKNYRKDTEAYKCYSRGILPPAHIQARAERYAVKIFLSHLFDVWYRLERGQEPPKPFAIGILGHAHMITPPPMVA